MDDFGESGLGDKSTEAFNDLGAFLTSLEIVKSDKKSCPPSTNMLFLGVEFDTIQMCMRVGAEKRMEVKVTVSK